MEFDIKERTNYLCVTGSHAFGTNTEHSDIDLKGFAIPPIEYLFSFDKHFEQNDAKYKLGEYPFNVEVNWYADKKGFKCSPEEELDQNIYDLRKFFKLAANCNPNIMSILFAHDDDVLYIDPIAKECLEHRNEFLSAKARHTYSGYAVSQLKRIKTHRRWLLNAPDHKPTRAEYNLPEQSTIPADQRSAAESLIEKQMRIWLLQEAEIERSLLFTIKQNLSDFIASISPEYTDMEKTARLAAMKKLGMTDNYMAILQAEKGYKAAKIEWTQYQEWVKNRNPARADLEARYGYDCKHAYHLVRLIRMAKEILLTGEVVVKRPDAEQLSKIRNGAWTYDELIAWADKRDKELEEIYREKKYVIPHKPNYKLLSKLCVRLHEKALV